MVSESYSLTKGILLQSRPCLFVCFIARHRAKIHIAIINESSIKDGANKHYFKMEAIKKQTAGKLPAESS